MKPIYIRMVSESDYKKFEALAAAKGLSVNAYAKTLIYDAIAAAGE